MASDAGTSLALSVIVVVRNGERALAGALDSIVAQTRQPDQVLVIDGQSTDRTAEIAQARDVEYLLQPDLGLASARNLGIRAATGELIAFLDHDDRWMPNKLERQLEAMTADPSLAYVTTLLRRRRADDAHGAFAQLAGDVVSGATPSTLLARRSTFDLVGPFDPSLRIGCDADWFARARDLALPTVMLDEVLIEKHLHATNLSADGGTNQRDMLEVIRRSLARKRSDGSPS
jgi:glycosyltransferase involved in cell wall biosynthesis